MTKGLKRFITKYQEEDKRADERKALIERLRARKQRDDFRALLARRHEEWLAERPLRVRAKLEDLPGRVTVFEETVEVLLSETVEPLA